MQVFLAVAVPVAVVEAVDVDAVDEAGGGVARLVLAAPGGSYSWDVRTWALQGGARPKAIIG